MQRVRTAGVGRGREQHGVGRGGAVIQAGRQRSLSELRSSPLWGQEGHPGRGTGKDPRQESASDNVCGQTE